MENGPDYTKYSLEALLDVQQRIDRQSYPERASAVDQEIARRRLETTLGRDAEQAVPVTLGKPIAIKPGRAPSLLGALASLGMSVIGVVMLISAFQKGDWYQILFMTVFCTIAISGLIYNIYNAFERNRFSQYDLVTSGQEPDPLAGALGYENPAASGQSERVRRFPGNHCPFCGAQAPETVDLCPSCGKDI